jgi:hypothetical protein
MSEQRRQRSFRDKLHGIGFNWKNKKSESFPGEKSSNITIPKK